MFCQSEAEWDSKATIDAIFLMLDGILLNARRWRANGKCILAGLTPNNVRLLKEKYDEVNSGFDDRGARRTDLFSRRARRSVYYE
uniref:Uncharacterized protein n=1 Tax=Caenorhabditis japonica TaxID=281687 RepID=A0A8R1IXQ1_CAEJA